MTKQATRPIQKATQHSFSRSKTKQCHLLAACNREKTDTGLTTAKSKHKKENALVCQSLNEKQQKRTNIRRLLLLTYLLVCKSCERQVAKVKLRCGYRKSDSGLTSHNRTHEPLCYIRQLLANHNSTNGDDLLHCRIARQHMSCVAGLISQSRSKRRNKMLAAGWLAGWLAAIGKQASKQNNVC